MQVGDKEVRLTLCYVNRHLGYGVRSIDKAVDIMLTTQMTNVFPGKDDTR
jgi:hypothetical protein